MKKSKIIEQEFYTCDCCGVEFESTVGVMGTMYGEICGSYGVVFEPKVFGDYCEYCIKLIQKDWNRFGRESICHDRYDEIDDNKLKQEIEAVKNMREICLSEED